MKAVVWRKYGSPETLELAEIETPVPGPNEVRVRVRTTTVTAGDCEMRSLHFPLWLSIPMRFYTGLRRPNRVRVLGMALAGEIDAVGEAVTQFATGDRVVAATSFRFGAYAEYACLPVDGLIAQLPDGLPYEEATVLPVGGMEALSFVRRCQVRSGDRVLIIGAGGTIGTLAVQLARREGAEVTAVDTAAKLELLASLGAARVVDYRTEDVGESPERFDVIADVAGKAPFVSTLRLLKRGGRYLLANPRLATIAGGLATSVFTSRRVIVGAASEEIADLRRLVSLVAERAIAVVIDRTYSLEEIVEAHRHAESGDKVGNIVIVVS